MSPVKRFCAVPLGPDTELRVEVVSEPGERPALDLRLYRRGDWYLSGFCPTGAGLRVPLHLCAVVAGAIRIAGSRGAVRHAARSGCQCED